jgi:hypothetical protein
MRTQGGGGSIAVREHILPTRKLSEQKHTDIANWFWFAAEVSSEDEDDPGLDGPDMDEILLSPASQIQPEDSAGPGNSKIMSVN